MPARTCTPSSAHPLHPLYLLRPRAPSPVVFAALALALGGHSLALAQTSPAGADRSPFVRPSGTTAPADPAKGGAGDVANAGQWYGTPNAGLTSAVGRAADAGVRAGNSAGGFLSGSGAPAPGQLPPPVPGSVGAPSTSGPGAESLKTEVKVRYVGEVNGKQLYRTTTGGAYFFIKEKRPDFKLQEVPPGDAGGAPAQTPPAGAAHTSSK